ncbi:aldo/keto reductase [Achromobacter sp. GG226]|uniref:aldo/keto reductase n=1 Tax=Verticiella alkaliphila TaxID=2779529 RepID=UPI001C0A9A61|nr:aldo/keto reductase [Verticiella sp. GG226]MBU4609242.1 aldo/keto reductase [Verticiella sp. GG226]
MLQHRELGQSGLNVAPLAFGGNVFGWTVDEPTTFRLLDAFVDAGLNLIDTADVYSRWVPGNQGGESETLIGKWLRQSGKRDRIVLATKVGKDMGEGRKGLAPAYIQQAVEASLRRLQTDHIDLYQSHDDDSDVPLADTLGAYARLIEQGKVRVIGASNYGAQRLAQALQESAQHGLPRYETLQPEYNLVARAGYEAELEPLVRANHLGVITFFPLASGFLTGKYRSEEDAGKSVRGKMIVQKYLNPRGRAILAALDSVAESLNATPAQVALAWQMSRPGICAPLASATSIEQLNELIGSTQLRLDADAIAALDAASAPEAPMQ